MMHFPYYVYTDSELSKLLRDYNHELRFITNNAYLMDCKKIIFEIMDELATRRNHVIQGL